MRLISTGASGIRAQQLALDTVGNNIANINTLGFKAGRVEFAETLATMVRSENTVLPIGAVVPKALSIGSGVLVNGVGTDFSQGPITTTDNVWDLSIQGEGFFQVTLPNGETAYTRAGSFKPNANGKLVDGQGNFLAVRIPQQTVNGTVGTNWEIPKEATDISVSKDGTITGYIEGNPQVFGQVTLARFSNPEGLNKIGDNLFITSANSGNVEVGLPGQNLGEVYSNSLEQSNVDMASAMTDLIQAQRAYQMNSRMVQDGDQMWGIANAIRR